MEYVLPFLASAVIATIISSLFNYLFLRKNLKHQEKILKITEQNKFELSIFENTFSEKMLNLTEKNKFRLAAIDKRLEVAQKAYWWWNELLKVLHDEENKGNVISECEKWWYTNCLYLSPKVRKGIYRAIRIVFTYRITKELAHENKDPKIVAEPYDELVNLSDLIEESVFLEPLHIDIDSRPDTA
jgi:hypothetical protein